MKVICMVKIVPDVDKFKYDFETNTVVRENVRMILNPDDACAVAFALKAKAANPDTTVEVVTMAPPSAMPILEDLIRRGVDRVMLLSDRLFSGSDSYATSTILAGYLKTTTYDCILTGTHAIDGDTSHVPSQIGELLDLNQMSRVVRIDETSFTEGKVVFSVESDTAVASYEMQLPGILSLQKESKYKLPYIKYADMNREVHSQIHTITNEDLNLDPSQIGLKGSLTKVNRTFVKEYQKRDQMVVANDEQGIEIVYAFLKEKGFLS